MFKLHKKGYFTAVTAILLLIFAYQIGMLGFAERILSPVMEPAGRFFHGLSSAIRTTYDIQTGKTDLSREIEEKQKQVLALTEENAGLKILREENKILREHLGFLREIEHEYVMANVTARGDLADVTGRTETIIIDKGRSDGIYAGLAVVSGKGVVVGKIMEVKESSSVAYLTNNKACKLAAAILEQDKTSGITEGDLGLTIKMNFIPQAAELEKGGLVVTSGLEKDIPRGLIIGRIIEVRKESNELWQEAVLEPLEDPENLIIVSVLIP